jgi:hypothetical protein
MRFDPASRAGDPASLRAALAIAGGGALAVLVLNVVFAVSAGLLAVAAVVGYLTGASLRPGIGPAVGGAVGGATDPGRTRRGSRTGLAVGLAVASIAVGAAGTWLASLAQGGVLGPVDYLAEAMGLLLPLQLAIAAAVAWLASR